MLCHPAEPAAAAGMRRHALGSRCAPAAPASLLPRQQGPTDGVRHSASGSGSDPMRGITLRRFAELDRDGHGRVSFLEASPGLLRAAGAALVLGRP